MQAQMLAPAAVLIAWSLVMLVWTAGARASTLKGLARREGGMAPGGRGQDLEGILPPGAAWKGHNYNHLMEQPTLFYAASVILALLGAGAGDVLAAWAYVALRIVHSVWQATVNMVPVRFTLFLLATLALLWLAVRCLIVTFSAQGLGV